VSARGVFWTLALGAALAWFTSCGGVDAGDGGAAAAKCQALQAVYCDRVLACGAPLTRQQCADAFASGIDCGQAVGIGPSYDRCLSELRGFDCVVLDGGRTLPASCNGVVLRP